MSQLEDTRMLVNSLRGTVHCLAASYLTVDVSIAYDNVIYFECGNVDFTVQ